MILPKKITDFFDLKTNKSGDWDITQEDEKVDLCIVFKQLPSKQFILLQPLIAVISCFSKISWHAIVFSSIKETHYKMTTKRCISFSFSILIRFLRLWMKKEIFFFFFFWQKGQEIGFRYDGITCLFQYWLQVQFKCKTLNVRYSKKREKMIGYF